VVSALGSNSLRRANVTSGICGMGMLACSSPKREPMVATGRWKKATASAPATTATRKPGTLGATFRNTRMAPSAATDSRVVGHEIVPRWESSVSHWGRKAAGRVSMVRPRKSFT